MTTSQIYARLAFAIGLLSLAGCPNSVGITCPTGTTFCNGACVSTAIDENNCGACGTVCPPTLACISGKCDCPQGLTKCGDVCVNTMADNGNCGACAMACPAGNVCSQGACGLSCQASLTNCSGTCDNLQTDRQNCGTCGMACPAGQMCSAGACALDCSATQKICNKTCIDPQTDIMNCGDCGKACKSGFVCSAGACAPTCGDNLKLCTGLCVDTQNDLTNCGDCAIKCPANQFCSMGKCTLPCPPGFIKCIPDGGASDAGTVCADPKTDPNNCGGCGGDDVTQPNPSFPPTTPHVCTPTTGFGTVAACAGGNCAFPCAPGFADCENSRPLRGLHAEPNGAPAGEPRSTVGANLSLPQAHSAASAAPRFQFSCFDGQFSSNNNEECCTPLQDNSCDCGGCGIGCNGWCDTTTGQCFGALRRLSPRGLSNSCFVDTLEPGFTQQCCGMSCVDTLTDGSCGNCSGTADCKASSKSCCADSDGTANGHCTDFTTIVDCGSCGNNCSDAQIPLCCDLGKGNGCTDGATDRNHCGACANDCTALTFPSPSPDVECCPAGGGAATCVDWNSDHDHCGACDNVCNVGDSCCFGSCKTLATDQNNCGACNHSCFTDCNCNGPGVCVGGACNCANCPPPT